MKPPFGHGFGRGRFTFHHRWAHAWRRAWNRFLDLFRRRPATVPVTATPVPMEPARTRSDSFLVPAPKLAPFRTPAQGDGFTFEIQANVVWEGSVQDDSERKLKASRERVEHAIEERKRTIRRELMTVIRPIARSYPPFEPARLEEHLYQVLPEVLTPRNRVAKPTNTDTTGTRVDPHRMRGLTVNSDDGYSMEIHLWVDPCEEITQIQQQVWRSVTVEAGRGTLYRRRIQEQQELQKAWQQVLTTLLTSMGVREASHTRWTELLALQLSQSPDPAENAHRIVEQIARRHEDATRLHEELADYLQAADGSDGRVRTMDFALASDTALTRVLDSLGVPDLAETRTNGLRDEEEN